MVAWWWLLVVGIGVWLLAAVVYMFRLARARFAEVEVASMLGIKLHPEWPHGMKVTVAARCLVRLRCDPVVQDRIQSARAAVLEELKELE